MTTGTASLEPAAALRLCSAALVNNRTTPEIADQVASALVAAEVDEQRGHGLARVAAYAAQARSGKVDGSAQPTATRSRPGFIDVDARSGFAYPALALAREQVAHAAHANGIACAAVRQSHHCGVLGHQVEALADVGLVALMVANAPKAIAPWGGHAPFFGTNPIAFAAPRAGGAPLVIDLALSKVARGKVMAAAKTGASIPSDWAVDASGAPTTDPNAALQGAMLAVGGAKGAALALIVEVLAGALAGPHFSFEASDFFAADGSPPALGQVLIAIQAGSSVAERIDTLLSSMAEQEGTRIPGERRLAARARAHRDGLSIPISLLEEITVLAEAPRSQPATGT